MEEEITNALNRVYDKLESKCKDCSPAVRIFEWIEKHEEVHESMRTARLKNGDRLLMILSIVISTGISVLGVILKILERKP